MDRKEGRLSEAAYNVRYLIAANNKEHLGSGLDIYTLFLNNVHIIERSIKQPLEMKKKITIVSREGSGENIENFLGYRAGILKDSKDEKKAKKADAIGDVRVLSLARNLSSAYCMIKAAAGQSKDYVVVYDGTSYFKDEIFEEVDKGLERLADEEDLTGVVLSAPREFEDDKIPEVGHQLIFYDEERGKTAHINGYEKESKVVDVGDEPVPSKKVPVILIYKKSEFEKLYELYCDPERADFKKEKDPKEEQLSIIEQIVLASLKEVDAGKKIIHLPTRYAFIDLRTDGKKERDKLPEFDRTWGIKNN